MKRERSLIVRGGLFAMLIALLFAGAALAAASTEFIVYPFPSTSPTNNAGIQPEGNLVADSAGNLYGTTFQGGAFTNGTVYELVRPVPPNTGWTRVLLYSFSPADGDRPYAGLVFDKAGNLYGTTVQGGASNVGTVFELSPPATEGGSWTESALYNFQGSSSDGAFPYSAVVFDGSGNLYGVTNGGGIDYSEDKHCGTNGCGVLYKLTPPSTPGAAWTETVLHFFNGGQGYVPVGPPILDAKGNLYGAAGGGGNASGVIYRLAPPVTGETAWTFKVLYAFGSATTTDARYPDSSLTLRGNGLLYGTSEEGGQHGYGTVFQLTPPTVAGGAWTENILYSFASGSDGAYPHANVIFDSAGNLYGTTTAGGGEDGCTSGCGTVYELSPPAAGSSDWTETILHSFPSAAKDGLQPSGGLIFGESGLLFGVTQNGGRNNIGAAYAVAK